MSERWVRVEQIKGGHVVFCTLCGRKVTRRFFMAESTNYAEALRLATAYEATHRMSTMHTAAIDVFHAEEAPPEDVQMSALAKVLNRPPPSERDRRKDAARRAAELTYWKEKRA